MRFHFQHTLLACVVLFFAFVSAGCDSTSSDNPEDTSALIGIYDMKSIQDKTGSQFELPGETLPTNKLVEFSLSDNGVDFTFGIYIEGSLTLSTQSYNLSTSVSWEIDQANTQNEIDNESGTYSVSGGKLTLVSSDPDSEGPETFTYSISGQTLTVENADVLAVFVKR